MKFRHPGIFIEEVPGGPRCIEGVGTSTAGAIGVTARGPATGPPRLVTSYAGFERMFGGPLEQPDAVTVTAWEKQGYWWLFAHSVKGFFDNGGQRMFVKRVVSDSPARLSLSDFIGARGDPGEPTGLQALAENDEVNISLAPGMWAPEIHQALIRQCDSLNDRFAVLDPPCGLDHSGILAFRAGLDSKNVALYYPWIEVRDPAGNQKVAVPPSGHIAGIYARVDAAKGVHRAPANEVIRGIEGLTASVTTGQQDVLNPAGINALRTFPARGHLVWGARTLLSDPEWKYVNVRRLLLYLEESICRGLQWVVFEPNEQATWARVRQSVKDFLFESWRGGALFGEKPELAFFANCGLGESMTQNDIDRGRLICVVGVAPVRPAEFMVFQVRLDTARA